MAAAVIVPQPPQGVKGLPRMVPRHPTLKMEGKSASFGCLPAISSPSSVTLQVGAAVAADDDLAEPVFDLHRGAAGGAVGVRPFRYPTAFRRIRGRISLRPPAAAPHFVHFAPCMLAPHSGQNFESAGMLGLAGRALGHLHDHLFSARGAEFGCLPGSGALQCGHAIWPPALLLPPIAGPSCWPSVRPCPSPCRRPSCRRPCRRFRPPSPWCRRCASSCNRPCP